MRTLRPAVLAVAIALTGCATSPVSYTATLSAQDPKWQTPACVQARKDAVDYEAREKTHLGWGAAPMFGPYGVPIIATIKEGEQKQRRKFSRQVHLNCSSTPLPAELDDGKS